MRRFLIRNFVLLTRCQLFGKNITYLRATRIMFPSFVLGAILVNQDVMTWYNIAIFAYWGILSWIGFSWFGLGYFKLFPVEWEELDNFQKYVWGKLNPYKLTDKQYNEWELLKNIYE